MLGGEKGGGRDRVHPQDSGRRADRQMGEGLRWWGRQAGCGEYGWTERPPSVGDGGDRQTVGRALGGEGGTESLADSCP